ncbi:MAG TPA: hypothetical protein VGS27_17545 [Candidatus Sulfotelmatobacter sp.]|nr:hypothetical protein [Candidatus Sulfotelmatobacter sp.]
MSLLRQGICRPSDWSGSAVDFVERGFSRFCRENGAAEAKKVWVGDLRIADCLFELTEQERNQMEAGREDATRHLFLIGDYEAAASIPIGATLECLEAEDRLLPAAFYHVLTANLYKWMRVYDYLDAQERAEMWMEDMTDEELEASVYRRVPVEIPDCIKEHSKRLTQARARALLEQIRPRRSALRQLIQTTLEMDASGQGHEHAWPGHLTEKDVPGIGDWLMDAESSRPGCLITWFEGDAINACFDEEAEHMGENGACQPNVAIPIHLCRSPKKLDQQVQRMFDHAGAMLRSLASGARVVEIIRELYDEHLRQHRVQSGLPAEPGHAGVRDQQLSGISVPPSLCDCA